MPRTRDFINALRDEGQISVRERVLLAMFWEAVNQRNEVIAEIAFIRGYAGTDAECMRRGHFNRRLDQAVFDKPTCLFNITGASADEYRADPPTFRRVTHEEHRLISERARDAQR